jgi:hypothetical protein
MGEKEEDRNEVRRERRLALSWESPREIQPSQW